MLVQGFVPEPWRKISDLGGPQRREAWLCSIQGPLSTEMELGVGTLVVHFSLRPQYRDLESRDKLGV